MMLRLCKYVSIELILVLIICLSSVIPASAQGSPVIILNGAVMDSGPCGTQVLVEGDDFSAGDSVSIIFNMAASSSQTVVPAFTLLTTSFNKAFTIPSAPAGEHTVTAVINGTPSATAVFIVVPSLVLSANSGSSGSSLTVSGYGFGAGETNIITTFDETPIGSSKTASSVGYWSNTFNVPALASGIYNIDAYGAVNNATAEYNLIANPKISLSKTSGPVGSSVTVTGSGFAGGEEEVTVTFEDEFVGSPTKVSTSGGWSLTFSIPPVPAGAHSVDAGGYTTATEAVNDLTFTVTPSFSVSPNAAAAGDTVSAEGSGFSAEEEITLTYEVVANQFTTVATTSADQNGSWSTEFTVPTSSGGSHTVRVKGSTTNVAPFKFKIGSGIALNKSSGKAGSIVTVTGSGFASNESGIIVTYDGVQVNQPVTASSSGSWKTNITIPASSGGDHIINAYGKNTESGSVSDVYFTITPEVAADKSSGKAGTQVTITGAGFGANESGIVITYDGEQVGSDVTANDKGNWSAAIPIPVSASGTHAIQVNGTATNLLSQGDLKFKVSCGTVLSPAEGNVGSKVSLTGSGFAADSALTVFYDDHKITPAGSVSDEYGNIEVFFSVPKSASGQHTIKVIDTANNQSEAIFNMDSTAPAAPKQASPFDGARIGLFGAINPTLEWSRVNDPSGVNYNLQIDTEPEFLSPLVDVTDLTTTKYTLNRSQTLPLGQYYWRVKTIDGASNESPWSQPLALQSGLISPLIFALIVILVVGALIIAIYFGLIPMIRRRKAYNAAAAREIVIPEVVNAEYRMADTEEALRKHSLPWRLALPQASAVRGSRVLSTEDQAKLKTIIEFARSVPLCEPGANTNWLIELAEDNTGNVASAELYSQLTLGEIQVRYEPSWMRHPTYLELQDLLEGQPILQDLNAFIDSVNRAAGEATLVLQDIYRDTSAEVNWNIFDRGGWRFISAVYADSFGWFMGKNLREPSERDYSIKTGAEAGLYGEPNSPFAGLLMRDAEEEETAQLRSLHLKLRKAYRNNERVKSVVSIITHLEMQRKRLLSGFSQFNRLNPG